LIFDRSPSGVLAEAWTTAVDATRSTGSEQ
jgi:hypothetical protein